MLYDIYYPDGSFDRCVALPKRAPRGARASCVNWDGHQLVAVRSQWMQA